MLPWRSWNTAINWRTCTWGAGGWQPRENCKSPSVGKEQEVFKGMKACLWVWRTVSREKYDLRWRSRVSNQHEFSNWRFKWSLLPLVIALNSWTGGKLSKVNYQRSFTQTSLSHYTINPILLSFPVSPWLVPRLLHCHNFQLTDDPFY